MAIAKVPARICELTLPISISGKISTNNSAIAPSPKKHPSQSVKVLFNLLYLALYFTNKVLCTLRKWLTYSPKIYGNNIDTIKAL